VPVSQLSNEHGVSIKSIYTWIARESGATPGTLQVARLKREK